MSSLCSHVGVTPVRLFDQKRAQRLSAEPTVPHVRVNMCEVDHTCALAGIVCSLAAVLASYVWRRMGVVREHTLR